jgi:hypothetical protein
MHEHHKTLRAAGGTDADNNLVFLCPSCHTSVHEIAKKILNGKDGSAVSLLETIYINPQARHRASILAKDAVASMISRQGSTAEYVRKELRFPIQLYRDLSSLARETKHTNNRRGTFESYVIAVLKDHVRSIRG